MWTVKAYIILHVRDLLTKYVDAFWSGLVLNRLPSMFYILDLVIFQSAL